MPRLRRVRLVAWWVVGAVAGLMLIATVVLGWRSFYVLSGWDRIAAINTASARAPNPRAMSIRELVFFTPVMRSRLLRVWQGFGHIRVSLEDSTGPPQFNDGRTGAWQSEWRWIDMPIKGVPVVDPRIVFYNSVSDWRFLGLGIWSDRPTGGYRRVIGIPHALFALVFAAVVWRAWRSIRQLRRLQAGQCMACGYDLAGLRAGVSCPECGGQPTTPEIPPKQTPQPPSTTDP